MDNERTIRWIFLTFSAVLIGLEAIALTMRSHYKYDFIFLMLLLFGVFMARKIIALYWAHYLFFAMFLLIHDLGMFRLYERFPFGLEYDYWVHILFGIVSSFIIMHFYSSKKGHGRWHVIILSIFLILGFSAAHEIYEFTGAIFLGEGEGVLFIGAGDLDEWDTQKDMLNNFLGALIGSILYYPYIKGRDDE